MKKIKRTDRVLNISHCDLDGTVCQILLKQVFDNIEFINCQFYEIDDMLIKIVNKYNYDFIILTDIHPEKEELLDISDNIILIDHHKSVINYHNPTKKRFIVPKFCGAKLVKSFCEHYFDIDLSAYNEMVKLTNDYDLWIHEFPKSKQLNRIFWYYFHTEFRFRFANGNIDFTKDEQDYITKKEIEFQNKIDNLKIYELDDVNGCLIKSDPFIDETCDYLLKKENYNIVFAVNNKNNRVSVRHNIEDFNVGELLKELNLGGGHPMAAGMKINNLKEDINKIVMVVYKKYKHVRKS